MSPPRRFNIGPLRVNVPFHFARKGDATSTHGHNFDHVTYVPRGAVEFELVRPLDESDILVDERTGSLHLKQGARVEIVNKIIKRATDGYNMVNIAAGQFHRLLALEDDTIAHCLFPHRNPQGDVVPTYDGWEKAYV